MTEYLRPTSLEEGLSLLDEHTRIVAGATDILPAQVQQQAWGRVEGKNWLDISGLAELRGLHKPADTSDGCWRIGALLTWSELIAADLPAAFAGLVAAAREVGGAQIQNRGTVVGNLCNASPAADGVPALLCLEASVEIRSSEGLRQLPLSRFIKGNRQTALQPNEMVTAVCIAPPAAAAQGYFRKLGARRYLVISIVMLSALVTLDERGKIQDIRIAVGSCSAVAQRLVELEDALRGAAVDAALIERLEPSHFAGLTPIDDARADAAYRRSAVVELVTRLLGDVRNGQGSV